MKPIELRYTGACRKCNADLAAGTAAVYERRVGVFCLGCAPTDAEDIRAYRQAAADHKAERYEEWAAKRRARAAATLKSHEPFTNDHAFNTQPGHIPLRARIIAQEDRAFESLAVAGNMEAKAARLRHGVRVAGDAETKRQARRDAVRARLRVGMKVHTVHFGDGVVERINRKTATVGQTGQSGTYRCNMDLSFIVPLANADTCG